MRKPEWIRHRIPSGSGYLKVAESLAALKLNAICIEGRCPNAGECFSRQRVTFIIMGNICTRGCLYCAVAKGIPGPVDEEEPERVAEAVSELGIQHAVITSVTRDDIDDGGASIFCDTVTAIKRKNRSCSVELLVPDFNGRYHEAIDMISETAPDIFNHNIETARSMFNILRPNGDYNKSIGLLGYAANKGLTVKTGLMAGVGETIDDIKATISDLAGTGCGILTVGQYLNPVKGRYEVRKYYHPEEFLMIEDYALSEGFRTVFSAPNVRSSYHAAEVMRGV